MTLYLLFVFGPLADWTILGPRPGSVDAGRAHREVVTVNGKGVEFWVAQSAAANAEGQPKAYLLEFCGKATRAEEIAQYVAARWDRWPVEVWVMNNPGAGGSEGSLRLKNVAPAALGAYDELRRRGNGRPIFVEANSLGTAAALCVAARREVAGCVLHDPVPLKQLILGEYGWWNLRLVAAPVASRIPAELDSVQNAKIVKCPAVFILASNDDYVLPKYHRMITEAYAGEKRFVSFAGGHWDSVSGDAESQLQDEIEWLWSDARTATTRAAGG